MWTRHFLHRVKNLNPRQTAYTHLLAYARRTLDKCIRDPDRRIHQQMKIYMSTKTLDGFGKIVWVGWKWEYHHDENEKKTTTTTRDSTRLNSTQLSSCCYSYVDEEKNEWERKIERNKNKKNRVVSNIHCCKLL
jgi:hypothetical protein